MQHTMGALKSKADDAGSKGTTTLGDDENGTLVGREAAAEVERNRIMTAEERSAVTSLRWARDELGTQHELDLRRATKRLLKYVVKSAEVDMMEAEYTNKFKTAGYNVCVMLVLTAAVFGLTNGWRFIDSFWFAFVTLSTLGYGDFTPETVFSRLVFVAFSKIGLGTMTLFLAEIVDYSNRQREIHRLAMERVRKAELDGFFDPKNSTLFGKRLCFGLLPPLKTNLQKSGYKAFKSLVAFFIIMFVGASALGYSEGWLYVDGLYFAFQTSSTIGYGDQSSLYNYWPPNPVTGSTQGLDDPEPINWGSVSIGHNFSLGEVPPLACIKEAQGLCTLSEDGTACECTFSDGAKLVIVVYFLLSAGSLAVLFDAALDYAEAVSEQAETVARRMSRKAAHGMGLIESGSGSGLEKGAGDSTASSSITSSDTGSGTKIVPATPSLPNSELGTTGVKRLVPTAPPASDLLRKQMAKSRKKCHQTPCFRLSGSVFACSLYMLFGAGVFFSLEPETFGTLWHAYYFCAISLTTIGYGDYCVSTPGAKIFLIFYCILGVALVTKFLAGVQKEMSKATRARVLCAQRMSCCRKSSEKWSDAGWLVIIVSIQALVFYALGLGLFLLFECVGGQEGNFYIEGDTDGTNWARFDVLLFFNSVTTTTIGYGANFYPRTAMGQLYIVMFAWFALGNTFFLIDAITGFVKQRAIDRWQIRAKDLMLTTGLSELERLLKTSDMEDEKMLGRASRIAFG